MKKAWHLQSWFLCVLFLLWPLFLVPLAIGIVLLVQSIKEDKRMLRRFEDLNQKLTDVGAMDAVEKHDLIEKLTKEAAVLEDKCASEQARFERQSSEYQHQIDVLKKDIIVLEDEVLLQSFGMYKPKYSFTTVEHYKAELEKIRAKQGDMVKAGTAATGSKNWTVNGSASQGSKMVKDMQKLLLRAFNSECDEVINRVKYNNFDASLKRITSSRNAISKLGAMMDVEIAQPFYNLKIDELRLALEYQQKKQQEKEDQKAIREQMREDAKIQREIEERRRKVEKEQSHYQNALLKIDAQIANASEVEKNVLLAKKSEIEASIIEIEKAIAEIDYRQANQKAGYVYVISNIGAFGENVYKIGMTRRLNPEERVDELGDASVPFDFDIHAMIFCDDAPRLEAELHKAFEQKKLNWVNSRREFFRVSLDEIKTVVKNHYDKTAEFIDLPPAEQYRTSEKMRAQSAS